jgi:hypothetical protein
MADDVALLVVHGIGAQERGETLERLLSGLRRVSPETVSPEVHDGVLATVGGQRVRLYEVYWADLHKGDVTLGAFKTDDLLSIAWFPWFNSRCGNYRTASHSFLKLAWWCVVLPTLSIFALMAHNGVHYLVGFFPDKAGIRKEAEGASLNRLDRLLDEYLGDVFIYVNSAGAAFDPAEVEHDLVRQFYSSVVQRFYDQLSRAANDCSTIQIVAHSLGTVVAYHGLSRFRFESDRRGDGAEAIQSAITKVRHLYTIGCPLEKFRFFWPRLAPVGITPLGEMKMHWDNFVSWFDPVAGILKSFGNWGKVTNHRLLGGGFIRGHLVYERSSVFLDALTQGLCGHEIPLKRGVVERLRDSLLLVGETLFAPILTVLVVLFGFLQYAVGAYVIAYVVSLPLWLFWTADTLEPFVGRVRWILVIVQFGLLLVWAKQRARRIHSRYWVAPPLEGVAAKEPSLPHRPAPSPSAHQPSRSSQRSV